MNDRNDRVFIEGISISGKHGVHESERTEAQKFIIDVVAYFDAKKAGESDNLADTIDYMPFAGMIEDTVVNNSFYLIERLAEKIAERILEDERITKVEVTVKKPAPLKGNGMPGIAIVRARV